MLSRLGYNLAARALRTPGMRFSSTVGSKIFGSPEEALHDMKDGAIVSMGGFGIVGIPENGVVTMVKKGLKDIRVVSNVAGVADWGIGLLLQKHQVCQMNASYVGENPTFEKQYLTGQIALNMIPQGTLAERCRIGGAGIAAAYVKAGVGTYVETGGFPSKLGTDGKSITVVSRPRERREFDGKEYLLEEAINVDFSLTKAFQADKYGNIRFRKTARNFNPDMCGAGRVNIVEVEHIVDEIPADKIHLPGCFVNRVYKSPKVSGKIERLKVRETGPKQGKKGAEEEKDSRRVKIAQRAVKELTDGMYCNLGIGIPVMVANSTAGKVEVELQGENGIVGMGPYPEKGKQDPDIINAAKETITEAIGSSHNRSSDAFGMMRGLHLHMTMLGSLQVSETADIANWIIPGQKVKGMGGAMDLVSCGSRVVVVMEHVGPGGTPKFIPKCTIPLTGKGVVSVLITDYAVFEFTKDGPLLTEISKDITMEELKKTTTASFKISPDLKKF
jgi:3-oxoacid CoA-transferase